MEKAWEFAYKSCTRFTAEYEGIFDGQKIGYKCQPGCIRAWETAEKKWVKAYKLNYLADQT